VGSKRRGGPVNIINRVNRVTRAFDLVRNHEGAFGERPVAKR